MQKKQLPILLAGVAIYALIAVASYLFFFEQMTQGAPIPETASATPQWLMGLGVGGFVLVIYGLLGSIGLWFAKKLSLPGVFSDSGKWRGWIVTPLIYGVVIGIFLAIVDQLASASGLAPHFPHPDFPFSILASMSAGIGEEILFRGFVFGLWAFLLNLVLKRWNKTTIALWIANILAALAFGASHFPAAFVLFGVTSPAEIPPFVIGEIFLLNGVLGLAAGERYMKDGLIAAVGVHFWADIVWHVIWPFIFA
jgi:membrane protease YdiL (CAAX protease family)